MSIVLKAFPLAFLISSDAKGKIPGAKLNLQLEQNNLSLIKVATNLKLEDIDFLMNSLNIPYKYVNETYFFKNGLQLSWQLNNGCYYALLSLSKKYRPTKDMGYAKFLVRQSEELFTTFDIIFKKNVRNINSQEFVNYCYKTPYKAKYEILGMLKQHKIENITQKTDLEICFRHSNKNYKYIRAKKEDPFYIEYEQKISLLNIASGAQFLSSKTMVTNYTDGAVLEKTLKEYGANHLVSDGMNVSCELFGMHFMYSKDFEKGPYNLEISHITDNDKCTKTLADLNEEYCSNIQELIYKRIVERIKLQNFRIENEEVEEDNSIVLTIDIG